MVERRRRNPLVLTSTKNLINSVLSEGHRVDGSGYGDAATSFQLPRGILRLSKDSPKLASLDDSALVGLSTPALKRLSITACSLDAGKIGRRRVLLIAAADSSKGLPPTIRSCFSHEISMGPLTEEQGVKMVSQSLQKASELFSNTGSEEFIKDIVKQTSGFMPRDICALIADAGAKLISRGNVPMNTVKSEESDGSLRSYVESDSKSSEVAPQFLGKENLTKALERSKKRKASALGTPKHFYGLDDLINCFMLE
ncbi:peroxisome biogenesis protein 6-like [Pyrus x bretschneideri]|uniref:peroxisome biogenesis protein 6-like n=1 Tax=Pyrus x bretschneideri TaxID=225117 RepID=UPI0020303133|nr:peroxisome biogenesis protein 6-like [Pyrus x bretschneideri]